MTRPQTDAAAQVPSRGRGVTHHRLTRCRCLAAAAVFLVAAVLPQNTRDAFQRKFREQIRGAS